MADEFHDNSGTPETEGVKQYESRSMFNERTCIECGRLDGKMFNMADKQPGINFPPIHPNCRCTTAAALSKEAKERLRETAIKNGHKLPLRDQMTFEEWKKQQGAIANMGANVPIGPVYEATPEVKAEAQKLVDKGIVGKMELDSTYTVKDVQRIGSELESIQKTYGVPPPASITTHMSRGNEGAASEYKFGTDAIAVNTRDRFKATHSRMMGGYERAKKELKKGQPFYPRATAIDNLEDMIAHEEAHHLHDLASRAVGKDIRLGEAYGTEVLGEFRTANIDGANRIVWKDAEQEVKGKKLALSVSKYASTNPVDLFAEAFVLYRKDANSIPKELREVIEGAIRLAGGEEGWLNWLR
ncbi:MAG: minor capsid protein [Candidatus Methanomethylophilaceae archaeon]|nr:minor capsid protein [Candidatus Methanomethylophilaceae archaeon]